jgi:hypothetical protein
VVVYLPKLNNNMLVQDFEKPEFLSPYIVQFLRYKAMLPQLVGKCIIASISSYIVYCIFSLSLVGSNISILMFFELFVLPVITFIFVIWTQGVFRSIGSAEIFVGLSLFLFGFNASDLFNEVTAGVTKATEVTNFQDSIVVSFITMFLEKIADASFLFGVTAGGILMLVGYLTLTRSKPGQKFKPELGEIDLDFGD